MVATILSFLLTTNDKSGSTIGTIISMNILFIITYTWIVKQNRIKVVEESGFGEKHDKVAEHNYFYKKRVLTIVKETLEIAIKFNYQLVETIKSGKPHTETPKKYRKSLKRCCSQLDSFIVAVNSDTSVPFDIGDEIDSLILQIRKTITNVLEESQVPCIILDEALLVRQLKVFNLGYFMEDRNKRIQELLQELKDTWFKIEWRQSEPGAWRRSPQWAEYYCSLHNLEMHVNGNSGAHS